MKLITKYTGHTKGINSITLILDETKLLTGSNDSCVKL